MREWLGRQAGGAPYWLLLLIPAVIAVVAAVVVPAVTRAQPMSAPVPSASYTPVPAARFSVPDDPRLLVFGDSYTEGFAANPETDGYAHLIGRRLGWTTDVDGVGGTGYTYGGGGRTDDYVSRIREYIRTSTFSPNVIVLEGSQNDYRDVEGVTAAVERSVRLLRGAYPKARIVLFGPAAPQPLQANLAPIDQAVAAAALQEGLPYISPYQERWITVANTATYGYSDGAHLNTAGHAFLADRFLEDFEPLFGMTAVQRAFG